MHLPSAAKSELNEYLHSRDERRKIFPKALLVGLVAGAVATLFRAGLALADATRERIALWAHQQPFGILWLCCFSISLAVIGVWLVRRYAPEASGSGIPHLEAVLHRYKHLNWKRVLPVKFGGGVLAIGSGMLMGREGPTVQMGGSVGLAVGELTKSSERESLVLVAAGAGAGLAAAFNAPLAGLVFVLEELQKDFRPTVFGAAFLAAAAADTVARLFTGQLPAMKVAAYATQPLSLLPAFILLGVLSGVIGVTFNKALLRSVSAVSKQTPKQFWTFVVLVATLVGVGAYFSPWAVGGGHTIAEEAAAGNITLGAVLLFYFIRFAATHASYATGAAGGIFAPMLSLGALFGLAFGIVAHYFFPTAVLQPGVFAVVGMAAYFTAVVRAPLTGIVLIVEMTSSYSQMLPLLLACLCSYIVAEAMGDLPIYEALLQRDLAKGGAAKIYSEPIVLEEEVQPNALFVGRRIKDLGLPPGVLVASIRQGESQWLPTAESVIEPHMRLTALVAGGDAEAAATFRDGCHGHRAKSVED